MTAESFPCWVALYTQSVAASASCVEPIQCGSGWHWVRDFWLVVLALSLLGGVAPQLSEGSVVGANARLLLVIPLCFVCESVVGPRMTA